MRKTRNIRLRQSSFVPRTIQDNGDTIHSRRRLQSDRYAIWVVGDDEIRITTLAFQVEDVGRVDV